MNFSQLLFEQFDSIRRDLPWRRDRTPYRIWISEIMLQQTTVQQAIPYFEKFVKRFPDLPALALAKESDVLALWQGLGYYTRARKLHACACILYYDHRGQFPEDYEALLKLPGIGSYTAAALASLAFGQAVPALDSNVSRVTARLAGLSTPVNTPLFRKQARAWLKMHMPAHDPGRFNEALIETGALICLPRKPLCHQCTLSAVCYAFRHGLQDHLPLKEAAPSKKPLYLYCLLLEKNGALALVRRPTNSLWGGMWDVPYVDSEKPLKRKLIQHFEKKYDDTFSGLTPVTEYHFVLTHRRVHCTYLRSSTSRPEAYQWVSSQKALTESLPLARAARHAFHILTQQDNL